jgi:hypothetical protein
MDKNFMEFWGNFLINAAKSQKQFEDMTQWMGQNLSGFDELTAMFKKFYGLDGLKEDSPDYVNIWQTAAEEFQNSFQEYLGLMGMVPKNEHLNLVKKYEELKRKVADQEETIEHLRMLLKDSDLDQSETIKGLTDLTAKQADQFQELMSSFGQFIKLGTTTSEEGKK